LSCVFIILMQTLQNVKAYLSVKRDAGGGDDRES
jgi:hypothetical protein